MTCCRRSAQLFLPLLCCSGAIMQVYQACFESPVEKGQHILSKPPGEWELRVVWEVNLLQEPAKSFHQCIQRGTHDYLSRLIKSLNLRGSLRVVLKNGWLTYNFFILLYINIHFYIYIFKYKIGMENIIWLTFITTFSSPSISTVTGHWWAVWWV